MYLVIILLFFVTCFVNTVNDNLSAKDLLLPDTSRNPYEILSTFYLVFIAYSFQDAFILVIADLKS